MDEVHMKLPLCDGMHFAFMKFMMCQAALITYYYTDVVLLSEKRHEKIV